MFIIWARTDDGPIRGFILEKVRLIDDDVVVIVVVYVVVDIIAVLVLLLLF